MRAPGYYSIIPASVRLDERLPFGARLLYAEITALTQQEGYAWASNAYFAKAYKVGDRAVQLWLKTLQDLGYIQVIVTRGDEGTERKICLTEVTGGMNTISPPPENSFTPRGENIFTHNNIITTEVELNTKEEIPPISPTPKKPANKKTDPSVTPDQRDKLVAEFGDAKTQAAIEYLALYKAEKGYKTKSDYLAILRWVMQAVTKNQTTGHQNGFNSKTGPRETAPNLGSWGRDATARAERDQREWEERASKGIPDLDPSLI